MLIIIKNKINELFNKKFLSIITSLLLLSIVFFTGCADLPKYTYEEYKKIKAFNENKDTETAEDNADNNEGLTDSEVFYKDLESYNSFISEFKAIYSSYSDLLSQLFDSFNNEQEDLDKKNQDAESIILYQEKWLDEIKEIDAPGIMAQYNDYFKKYLEKEILYYESFLDGDTELLEKYQVEADDMYNNIEGELQRIEESFNTRALELGIDQPFDK